MCTQIKSLSRILLLLFDFLFAKSSYHPLVRNSIKMFHQTAKKKQFHHGEVRNI